MASTVNNQTQDQYRAFFVKYDTISQMTITYSVSVEVLIQDSGRIYV